MTPMDLTAGDRAYGAACNIAAAWHEHLADGGAQRFSVAPLSDGVSDEVRAEYNERAVVTCAAILMACEVLAVTDRWATRLTFPVVMDDGSHGWMIERVDADAEAI